MTRGLLPTLACTLFLTAAPAFAASHGGHHSSHSHSHSSSHHASSHSSSSHASSHGTSSSSHSTHAGTHTTTAVHSADRCTACDRDAHGRILRSQEAKKAFMEATGHPHGRPGYVIDHIQPLACGGADSPGNMQWQTIADAKAKDKIERKGCH